MEVSKCWKIIELPKDSLKMKNCKTLYKAQTASRLKEVIQPPPTHPHQINPHNVVGTKIFLQRYTEIYRHLLSKCFKNVALGRQEMVQWKCFFWHQLESRFWLCCRSIFFIKLSGLRFIKWVVFFEWNLIVKWVSFFASFCRQWDILQENLKMIDKLQIWSF